jgi:hypothetical protein
MTSLQDQYNLAVDPVFQSKVRMASIQSAIAIQAEPRRKGFESYYDKRSALANTVLGTTANSSGAIGIIQDVDVVVQRFAYAVASNPSIDAPSSDSDIQFTVNSIWDALAGVNDDEKPEVTP